MSDAMTSDNVINCCPHDFIAAQYMLQQMAVDGIDRSRAIGLFLARRELPPFVPHRIVVDFTGAMCLRNGCEAAR